MASGASAPGAGPPPVAGARVGVLVADAEARRSPVSDADAEAEADGDVLPPYSDADAEVQADADALWDAVVEPSWISAALSRHGRGRGAPGNCQGGSEQGGPGGRDLRRRRRAQRDETFQGSQQGRPYPS